MKPVERQPCRCGCPARFTRRQEPICKAVRQRVATIYQAQRDPSLDSIVSWNLFFGRLAVHGAAIEQACAEIRAERQQPIPVGA